MDFLAQETEGTSTNRRVGIRFMLSQRLTRQTARRADPARNTADESAFGGEFAAWLDLFVH